MRANELTLDGVDDPIAFLHTADIEIDGRLPWSSNATFLVTLRAGDAAQRAVYKPVRGERPLWDFPAGLHRRERAAYLVSEVLGVGVVPPTVIRDGPLGEGSFQWFVDADHSEHYFTVLEARDDLHERLVDIAVFDIVANNTDRKAGHCLLAHDTVWAIDNGLCFAEEFKLRTVIWDFAGTPLPDALVPRLEAFATSVPLEVAALLTDDEVAAISQRCAELLAIGELPADTTGHRYPWPLI